MERLDVILVKKNIVSSRERAKELIKNGLVTVNGRVAVKPAESVAEDSRITVTGETLKYVSRGGLKLEKAIEFFDIDIKDATCADIGASTGGFTDCMLMYGAKRVYAIDVGTEQLSEKLRTDPRVISIEQTNIRYVTLDSLNCTPFDFISCDVSFISLTKVLPVIFNLLSENGRSVCLIKPQFEAGKKFLSKKGVVNDEKVRKKVLDDVSEFALLLGFKIYGITDSPIKGPNGNIEYLMYIGKVPENE